MTVYRNQELNIFPYCPTLVTVYDPSHIYVTKKHIRHGATKMAHLPVAMRQLIFFHTDGRLCLPYHTFCYSKHLQTTACVNSMIMGQYREIFGSRPPVLAEFNNLEYTNLTSPADRPQVLSAQSAAPPAPLLSAGKQERRSSYQTQLPPTLLHPFQLFIEQMLPGDKGMNHIAFIICFKSARK